MSRVMLSQKRRQNCEDCQGKGYVLQASGGAHYKAYLDLSICHCTESRCLCDKTPPYMWYDDKNQSLKPCSCRGVRSVLSKIRRLYQISKIPTKYRFHRLNHFEISHADDDVTRCLTQAYDNAEYFLEELYTNKKKNGDFVRGWYFHGPPGSGKTLLSCLILNECILRYQLNARYVKIARDFLNQIKASYNQESGFYGQGESIMKQFYQVDILVLDDFGIQQDTEWEKRMLYDLIDTRYEYAKTTIITSNLQPEELEPLFGGRILSRIKEMMKIQDFSVPDYRERFVQ